MSWHFGLLEIWFFLYFVRDNNTPCLGECSLSAYMHCVRLCWWGEGSFFFWLSSSLTLCAFTLQGENEPNGAFKHVKTHTVGKYISYTSLICLAFTVLMLSVVGFLRCAKRVILKVKVKTFTVHSTLYCCFELVTWYFLGIWELISFY